MYAEVRPVHVNASLWDHAIESDATGAPALPLGLRQVKGQSRDDGDCLAAFRNNGYRKVRDVWRKAGPPPKAVERLAEADAVAVFGLTRHDALWRDKAIGGPEPLPLFAEGIADIDVLGDDGGCGTDLDANANFAHLLPKMTLAEMVLEDYASPRLSLRAHPLALLRRLITLRPGTTSHEQVG